MKYLKITASSFLLFIAAINVYAQKVVVIGLDGFSTEGFKTAKHPNIDRLFAGGALSLNTRPVMPSVTMPNWTSHLTGSGPEEHGVTSNKWTFEQHELMPTDVDQDGYYPSIFKVLKEQIPKIQTAYYYNWANLILPMNKKYLDEVSLEDSNGYIGNYRKASDFLIKNRQNPAMVFLYSVHIDYAGHEYGWMSPQYIAAIEQADTVIGRFIDDLKKQKVFADTHFMLITDHGGVDKGHGGTSMREMQIPWAITGPKIKKTGLWKYPYNSNKNTSLVITKLFGVRKLPESWIGQASKELFK